MRTLGRSLAVTCELCRHEALSHGRLGIPYGLAVFGPIVEFFGGLALVLGVATPCSGAHRVHISGHRHRASVLGVRRASSSELCVNLGDDD